MFLERSTAERVVSWEKDPPPFHIRGRVSDRLLFGNSEQMEAIGKTIKLISDTDVPVLIVGESGTGKELVANAVHLHSLRKGRPLVKVNCVAIPGELLESELFGYEKGAFTGAYNSKPGRFEFAHKGTLFLDEIGDMPLPLQAKLLGVLQEGKFFRLGGKNEVEVDIRIMAATNQNLEDGIRRGTFREDLFYRLNVVRIRIPPLRERKEETPILINHFFAKYSQIYNKSVKELSKKTLKLLMEYDWPGNVRELENVIKKFVVLDDEDLVIRELNLREIRKEEKKTDIEYLPLEIEDYSLKEIGRKAAAKAEKVAIEKTLEYTHWNRRQAAQILKISYKTLLNKIKETGLDAG